MEYVHLVLNGFVNMVDGIGVAIKPSLDLVGVPLGRVFQPIYSFNEDTFSPLVGIDSSGSLFILILPVVLILSGIFRLIPIHLHLLRHLYNIGCGVFLVSVMYQWEIILPLFLIISSYLLLFLPPKISSKITIVYVFVFLSACQLYQQYAHYLEWKADVTGVLMVLIFKIAAVPFNMNDAKRLKSSSEKIQKTAEKNLLPHHKEVALKKRPNFIQYLSHCFFFATVITGPVSEMKHYIDFVESEKKIPFDGKKVMISLGWSVLFMVIFSGFGMIGWSPDMFSGKIISQQSLPMYFLMGYVVMFGVRGKYCFIWYFAEATCAVVGYGYTGKDHESGNHTWKNTQACNAIQFETATSVRTMIIEWNISVSKWLRYYVYCRVPFKSKTIKSLLTMTMSAFWHGFYPGYYAMWTALVFLNQMYILWYSKIYCRFFDRKKDLNIFLRVLLIIIAQTLISHVGTPFVLYTMKNVVTYYMRVYFGVHIFIFVIFLILSFIPRPPRKAKRS